MCWCCRCTQCKYLGLFSTEAGRRGPGHQTQARHHCYFSEYLLWRGTWRPPGHLYHATNASVPQCTRGTGALCREERTRPSRPIVCLFPLLPESCAWARLRTDNPLPDMFHSTHSPDSVVQFNLKKHLIIRHIITQ